MTPDESSQSQEHADDRSLGQSITAAREARGYTVAEVSERTRIRSTVIRAIENDSFDLCGGDVYARGHLRSIAAVVGLDPTPLVAQFDLNSQDVPVAASEVFPGESGGRERKGANWSAAMAVALVIAVALVAVQVFRSGDDVPRDTTTIANPTTSAAPEPSVEPTDPEPNDSQVAQAHKEVLLKVAALPDNLSWVQVTNSEGRVLFSDNLAHGQAKTFRDRKALHLVLGNAAGVDLVVNGSDVGTPGASGEVARLTFTPDDPEGAAG